MTTSRDDAAAEERTETVAQELDRGPDDSPTIPGGAPHALVVDPDPPGRIQLVAELERLGYLCQAASTGPQAMDLLTQMLDERYRRIGLNYAQSLLFLNFLPVQ
jgi:hypothetical protein